MRWCLPERTATPRFLLRPTPARRGGFRGGSRFLRQRPVPPSRRAVPHRTAQHSTAQHYRLAAGHRGSSAGDAGRAPAAGSALILGFNSSAQKRLWGLIFHLAGVKQGCAGAPPGFLPAGGLLHHLEQGSVLPLPVPVPFLPSNPSPCPLSEC